MVGVNPPEPVAKKLYEIRDRVLEVRKKYGSLANYGYPIIQSVDEAIAIVYTTRVLGITETELARMLGLDKTTTFKWLKAYDEGRGITYYDVNDKKIKSFTLSIDEVSKVVEEWLKPKASRIIKDITQSSVVQEFLRNPVKIQKSSKHGSRYTISQINETLRALSDVVSYINVNKEKIERTLNVEVSSNPDYWDNEDVVIQVVQMYCNEKETEPKKQLRCKRTYLQMIKRIPKFREWFKGSIGSVKNVLTPKESTLYYEHYLKLKKLAEQGDNELKAFWLIAGLHIETGAREGWDSAINKCERELASGVDIKAKYGVSTCNEVVNLDLDSDLVSSSLIGIKWDNAIWSSTGELLGFRVWEEKTQKEWELRVAWLDEDIHKKLKEIYTWNNGKHKSVIKTILNYYGVMNNKLTISKFQNWYSKMVHKLKDLLNLPWDLTPHRLRSAHISILAQFRIPMELVLVSSANTGFGVGWDDITTATIFYLRYSQALVEEYIKQAETIKERYKTLI